MQPSLGGSSTKGDEDTSGDDTRSPSPPRSLGREGSTASPSRPLAVGRTPRTRQGGQRQRRRREGDSKPISERALTASERPPQGPGGSASPGPQPPRRTCFLGAAAAPCRPRSTPAGPRSDSPRPPASQPTPGAESEARREETGSAAPEASSRPGPARGLRVPRREERGESAGGSGARRPPAASTAHTRRRDRSAFPPAPSPPPGSAPHRQLKASTHSGSPPVPVGQTAAARPPLTYEIQVPNRSRQPSPGETPAGPAPRPIRAPPVPAPRLLPTPRPRPRVGPRPAPLTPPPLAEAPVDPQDGCSATAPPALPPTAVARLSWGGVRYSLPGLVRSVVV